MLKTIFCTQIKNVSKFRTLKLKTSATLVVRRHFSDDFNFQGTKKIPSAAKTKYEPFRDDRAPVILDVEEERRKLQDNKELKAVEHIEEYDPFYGISPERGVEGVLDIEEVVDILRGEQAQDIFVAEVPPEYKYVKYIVVVHGKSFKHMQGMTEYIRKVFKYKRHSSDIIPIFEGKESKDWMALDLGNIALHIFSKKARQEYDLESLWSVGAEFDKLYNTPDDPILTMLNQQDPQSLLLNDLVPAEESKPE